MLRPHMRAYHALLVSARTISRDLKVLRGPHADIPLPLRSTVHDISPVLTHRVRIVRRAVEDLSPVETAHALGCSMFLVNGYLVIDRELETNSARPSPGASDNGLCQARGYSSAYVNI